MEVEELSVDEEITIGDMTLIPIVKVSIFTRSWAKNIFLSGSKKPEAIVILTPLETKVLKISGEEVPLEKFLEEFPGLKEHLIR